MTATKDVLSLPGLTAALVGMVILAPRRPRIAAQTAATHLVRTMALLAPADLPCGGVGVCPSAGWFRPRGTHVRADCLEPALHVRLCAGAALACPPAALPVVATPAPGGGGTARVPERDERLDVRAAPGRAASPARAVFSLEVPDPYDVARGVSVLVVRSTDLRKVADHRQGTRRRYAAHLRNSRRHLGVRRRAVRGADARAVAADRGC